jgi:hypothetical protein
MAKKSKESAKPVSAPARAVKLVGQERVQIQFVIDDLIAQLIKFRPSVAQGCNGCSTCSK